MKNSSSPIEWVIDFTSSEHQSSTKGGKPSVTLIFPEQKTTKQETSKPDSTTKKTFKALEFLNQIQEACRDLKGECQETLERKNKEPYEEKLDDITDDIKYLFGVIQEFTELMQKIDPPPEDPKKEDPSS